MTARPRHPVAIARAPRAQSVTAQTSITAATFKAKCLRLLDTVAASGKSIVITKRGKPVARLVPLEPPGARATGYGFMKGKTYVRDPNGLLSTGEAWDADE